MRRMNTADLIRALGGPTAIARRIGCTTSAVAQWGRAGIPRDRHLAVWQMALEAGVDWEPPGADEIRARLRQVA